MTGFLLYLLTIDFVPHYLFFIPFLYLFYIKRREIILQILSKKIDKNYLIILVVIILSIINMLIGFGTSKSYENLFIPYTIGMVFAYFIGKHLSITDFKVLVIFILVEIIVAIIEYLTGVNTFFINNQLYERFESGNNLLYFARPFGLSNNSSLLALKIMLSILLLEYFNLFKRYKWLFYIFFFTGITLTFSRTVIFSILIFYFLFLIFVFLKDAFLHYLHKIRFYYNYILILFIFFILSFIFLINFTGIEKQITRDGKPLLSGREIIWPQFKNFIRQHPVYGNHSKKLFVDYHEKKESAHAHNSYLETLASHGILIFSILILLIITNINKENFIYILVILIYSTTQYGIFWGISITDIILFTFFQPRSHYFPTKNTA